MSDTPATQRVTTGEELYAMGDIGRCELVEGRIVRMSPTGAEHSAIEAFLVAKLLDFAGDRKLGWVLGGEVGLYTRRQPDTVRGADVAFVSRRRLPGRPGAKFLDVAPELIAEILSPTDPWREVKRKIDEYFTIGVERVWVVNPRTRTVLVHRTATEATTLGETDLLHGEGVLEGFELPVASLFAE